MTEEVRKKLFDCMERLRVNSASDWKFTDLRYEIAPCPPACEAVLERAARCRREGKYDEALSCCIDIFRREMYFHLDVMREMCRALICDGELLLAFYLLTASVHELVRRMGPCPVPQVPSVPWAQLDDILRLERACADLVKTRDLRAFCAYAAPIAEDPYYVPACDLLSLLLQAEEIARLMK